MKQTMIACKVLLIFTIITGILYPLLMTGIAKSIFAHLSEGSIVTVQGKAAGSKLIGQNFLSAKYFHGRPSVSSYNALNSGGSNYGPTNALLIEQTAERTDLVRKEHSLSNDAMVPSDMVLSSASGLDPHISFEAAVLQVPRVAKERVLKESDVYAILNRCAEKKYFNLFGQRMVNVLILNIALDAEKEQ